MYWRKPDNEDKQLETGTSWLFAQTGRRENGGWRSCSPGYIGTKMVTAIPQEVLQSKILPQIPMSRLGKPEEVAGLVAYLASDEAAFVNGANISINGGQHMF